MKHIYILMQTCFAFARLHFNADHTWAWYIMQNSVRRFKCRKFLSTLWSCYLYSFCNFCRTVRFEENVAIDFGFVHPGRWPHYANPECLELAYSLLGGLFEIIEMKSLQELGKERLNRHRALYAHNLVKMPDVLGGFSSHKCKITRSNSRTFFFHL